MVIQFSVWFQFHIYKFHPLWTLDSTSGTDSMLMATVSFTMVVHKPTVSHASSEKKENNTILTVSLKLRWKEAATRVISVFSIHRKQPDERQTACMLTAHPFNCQSEQSWSSLFLKLLGLLQRSITRSNLRAYHLQGTYTHWRSGRFGVGSVLWLQWPYFTSHDLLTSQPDKHLPVGFWPTILHSYS